MRLVEEGVEKRGGMLCRVGGGGLRGLLVRRRRICGHWEITAAYQQRTEQEKEQRRSESESGCGRGCGSRRRWKT